MSLVEKHVFALYCPALKLIQIIDVGVTLEFTDEVLWHRIVHVLRLTAGEMVILFDGVREISLELAAGLFAGKKKILGIVHSVRFSNQLMPRVTLMPSLLKREAFETVVYLAAQMGAAVVQPLLTSKVQRSWHGDKEEARLMSIMIAACEQAKNFIIPVLKKPIPLTNVACVDNGRGVYFEDDGQSLMAIAQQLKTENVQELTLIFGPEGGLTSDERKHLDAQYFVSCALTPTILRAQEAVAVGLGSMRSLLG